ncbi:MAG: DUF1015 family protein [Propionibacteriales bacterium]|nr:DUF1015 family protein [Propionibacteriales bacterium]
MSEDARAPGLVLAPFRGLRYGPSVDDPGAVTAPPYDVLDAETVPQLLARHPHNVVRLILPRRLSGATSYADVVRLLDAWQAADVLRLDEQPGLYVYEYRWDSGAVRGLIGALGLCDFSERIVLPHEDVLPPHRRGQDRAHLAHRHKPRADPARASAGCLHRAGRRRDRTETAA